MLNFNETFTEKTVNDIKALEQEKAAQQARFVNLHAKRDAENQLTLIYTFTSDQTTYDNYTVKVTQEDQVPSITEHFPAAFFFENETADLYGIQIIDIFLDYQGHFYNTAQEHPMALPPDKIDSTAPHKAHDIAPMSRPLLDKDSYRPNNQGEGE